jgi:hypothetical protein
LLEVGDEYMALARTFKDYTLYNINIENKVFHALYTFKCVDILTLNLLNLDKTHVLIHDSERLVIF